MNIKKLSKSIQNYIEDGCAYIAIYKKGRSWDHEILDCDSEDELKNDSELKELYLMDKNVIVVNGEVDNFGTNTLSDIEYRIRTNYEKGIGQIYFQAEFTSESLEDEKMIKNCSRKSKKVAGVIKQLFENSGIEVTQREFKDILQIATDDIRENRLKFGKKTSMEQMFTIAVSGYEVMKRVMPFDMSWPINNANKEFLKYA